MSLTIIPKMFWRVFRTFVCWQKFCLGWCEVSYISFDNVCKSLVDRRPQSRHHETEFKLKALTGYYKHLWTVLFWMAATKKTPLANPCLKRGVADIYLSQQGKLKPQMKLNRIYWLQLHVWWFFIQIEKHCNSKNDPREISILSC